MLHSDDYLIYEDDVRHNRKKNREMKLSHHRNKSYVNTQNWS